MYITEYLIIYLIIYTYNTHDILIKIDLEDY